MTRSPGPSLLPDGALPCVWMLAGLVGYKLCDRDHECDDCPFDRGFAGRTPAARCDRDRRPPNGLHFPDDRYYDRSHAWVQRTGPDRVRYGLDGFSARLLDNVTCVVLPPLGTRLEMGRPAVWLVHEGSLLPFRAPVAGPVISVNPTVQRDPRQATAAPYGEGWLLEISSDSDLAKQRKLVRATEQRERTNSDFARLTALVVRQATPRAGVGPTLADGGEPCSDLRRALGPRRYQRLIRRFIG